MWGRHSQILPASCRPPHRRCLPTGVELIRAAVAADALAETQVRWPSLPIVFCETRKLAEDYTYRYLAAALTELTTHADSTHLEGTLVTAGPLPAPEPSTADIRAWAVSTGLPVADRGRLPPEVIEAYRRAHETTGTP